MAGIVRCPMCKRPQPARGPDAMYWCDHCRGQFDNDPDEGGTHSTFNPAARLEREERRQANQRKRR